jgi:hypothetical protein
MSQAFAEWRACNRKKVIDRALALQTANFRSTHAISPGPCNVMTAGRNGPGARAGPAVAPFQTGRVQVLAEDCVDEDARVEVRKVIWALAEPHDLDRDT